MPILRIDLQEGFTNDTVVVRVNGREVFRVRIGPFTTMAQARAAFAEAQGRGHNDLIIVRE